MKSFVSCAIHVKPLSDFTKVYLSLDDCFSERNAYFGTLLYFQQRLLNQPRLWNADAAQLDKPDY